MLQPVSLYADTLSKFAAGVVAGSLVSIDDESSLKNPLSGAFLLREIRLGALAGVAGATAPGGVSVRIQVGRTPLTNDFIPLSLLSKRQNEVGSAGGADPTWIWRLPRPMLVPPNKLFSVAWRTQSWAPTYDDLSVNFVGTAAPPGEELKAVSNVPYATAFIGKRQVIASGDTTEESNSSDIKNPFNVPLYVQRFMGAVPLDVSDADCFATSAQAIGTKNLFVQVTGPRGEEVVHDRVPFWSVFSPIDRCWPAPHILAPKDHYIFSFDERYSNDSFLTNAQLGVAMIGHREVKLSEL